MPEKSTNRRIQPDVKLDEKLVVGEVTDPLPRSF
jgi:hypothetical protein